MGRFNRESFIIQDKDVLRDDYQPETLEERDEELDEYAAALRPVIQAGNRTTSFSTVLPASGRQLRRTIFSRSCRNPPKSTTTSISTLSNSTVPAAPRPIR